MGTVTYIPRDTGNCPPFAEEPALTSIAST